MRPSPLRPLVLALLAACRGAPADPTPEARADDRAAGRGVAVLELFTSEGCSSCPPADAVVAALGRAHGGSVLALGFHVDYWNELGWPDRFSTPEATARQRAYAGALAQHGVFTPELVVGGVEGFIGSDRGRAEAAIARAASSAMPVTLTLTARAGASGAVTIDVATTGAPADATLLAALVEREATTDVKAGENAGKTLHHVAVVRAFAERAAAARTTFTLMPPPGVAPASLDAVALVQRRAPEGLPVLGAATAGVAR